MLLTKRHDLQQGTFAEAQRHEGGKVNFLQQSDYDFWQLHCPKVIHILITFEYRSNSAGGWLKTEPSAKIAT